ncbi:MAG: nucleoside triphosphate pyrophosphohydrolase family protein [Nanoarchaeota archaeon]|nr:nucleoside triphosphate pyrophosphohydrolase family protein [Nanoarchaeota archaeon]MBU4086417.1 nucleoside triphosphate pyrophosphohydrolase family protein [Nanoarchaeota archaeon]
MKLSEYQEIAKKTAKKDYSSSNEEILTWACGITGEAGDVASCIKKTHAHKNDQKLGTRENIGDTLWYMAMICNFYGWNMDEILEENVKKLAARFPQGFTIEAVARERIDWNEGKIKNEDENKQ